MEKKIRIIANRLESGEINEERAKTLLLGLLGVSTRAFTVGEKVKWRGMNLVVVEVGGGEVLIATSENVDDENYNDWWVRNEYVC